MNHPNQFAEDPRDYPGPPQQTSTATIVIMVIVIIGGLFLLVCGGIMAMGVYMFKQTTDQLEQLAAEYDAELLDSPTHAEEYMDAYMAGDYPTALRIAEDALALDEYDAAAHNNKAWLLATCPEEEFRDGELAVEHATRACELTDWQNPGFLDTLAAAHAEVGDFETAVETQQQAIDLDANGFYGDQFRERQKLYQAETPYREAPTVNPYEATDVVPYGEIEELQGGSPPPAEAVLDDI